MLLIVSMQQPSPVCFQDLEAGLGLSRLSRDDFLRFLQLAAFFTSYTRLKHVSM